MSLFGSLFSGVSSLSAQSQSMGIISDNISNVNTIGYKATSARFETLITVPPTSTSYAPGGVRGRPFPLIDQQGLIQSSASPLDIGVSGDGFFVVRADSGGVSEPLYTRAGSFHADDLGNLVNTSGFFLHGWPLDPEGRLPGEPGNVTFTTSTADISSLEVVNIGLTNGIAAATTTVEIGANLTASEPIFTGPIDTSQSLSVTSVTDLVAGGVLANGETITLQQGAGAVTTFTAGAANDFTTLQGLADLINAIPNAAFTATISNGAVDAILDVEGNDPRLNMTIDGTGVDALFGGGGAAQVTAETYDPTNSALNMASNNVAPDFTRTVRVFDGLGAGHEVQMAFLKVASNRWAVEISAVPAQDVSILPPLVNGQLAVGEISFNGDATLASVPNSLSNPINFAWTNGSQPSDITFNFGTFGPVGIGKTDGLNQFNGPFNVAFVNQNGSEVGELNEVSIDEDGFVIAAFNNGETQRLFKIPLATFSDVSQLGFRTGNVFAQTDGSGVFNLREAGEGGAGRVAPSGLEASNVDLGEEFTDMIITQRAFTASSRLITTVDDMLDDLLRISQ